MSLVDQGCRYQCLREILWYQWIPWGLSQSCLLHMTVWFHSWLAVLTDCHQQEANFFLCLELNPTIRILEVHQWVSHQNRWKIGLPSLEKQKWRLHGCWHFGWGVDIKAKSATSWKSLFLALVAMSDIQCWRQYEVVMKIVGLLSAIHVQLAMISELVGSTYLI